MKRIGIKLVVSFLTFAVGVSATYFLWLVFSRSAAQPIKAVQAGIQWETPTLELKENERKATSIEQEWKELTQIEFCFLGNQGYSPSDKDEVSRSRFPYGFLPSLQKDERAGTAFLIKQISDRSQTRIHICPLDTALKGELAIYCLQHILKVNWYDLKDDYRTRYDNINYDYSTHQALLRKLTRSKKGAQEMMKLWAEYYEAHPPAPPED